MTEAWIEVLSGRYDAVRMVFNLKLQLNTHTVDSYLSIPTKLTIDVFDGVGEVIGWDAS